MGELEKAPGSYFWISPALVIIAIWAVNQEMEEHALSLSLSLPRPTPTVALTFKENILKRIAVSDFF